VAAGYSLGGNLALRLAGTHPRGSLPTLAGVCAVSPVLDLEACVRALERRSNFIYQWNFVRNLKRRMRRKIAHFPGAFDLSRLDAIRTVRQFDAAYTAPYFGFASAEDYYHRAAALRVIDRIEVPALIITAEDDPFVPYQSFRDSTIARNPHVTLVVAKHGGHCGFLAEPHGPDDDGYWAERQVVDFATRVIGG
jgi:predicted alpha/beta-fold hydrolase